MNSKPSFQRLRSYQEWVKSLWVLFSQVLLSLSGFVFWILVWALLNIQHIRDSKYLTPALFPTRDIIAWHISELKNVWSRTHQGSLFYNNACTVRGLLQSWLPALGGPWFTWPPGSSISQGFQQRICWVGAICPPGGSSQPKGMEPVAPAFQGILCQAWEPVQLLTALKTGMKE